MTKNAVKRSYVINCTRNIIMMIKLKMFRRVMDFPIASTKQTIDDRNILVRNFQGGGLLGRPRIILKIILKRSLTVRLIGCEADNRNEVVRDRV